MHAHIQIYMNPRRQETGKFVTAILTGIIRNKNYYYQCVSGPAVITEFATRNESWKQTPFRYRPEPLTWIKLTELKPQKSALSGWVGGTVSNQNVVLLIRKNAASLWSTKCIYIYFSTVETNATTCAYSALTSNGCSSTHLPIMEPS
jgi:hypothetical protein